MRDDTARGIDTDVLRDTFAFDGPRDQWLAVLKSVGFCETLVTEVRLPSMGPSAGQLSRAVAARNEGRYADAIAACRMAIEGLDGAPKEASSEVERIIKVGRKRFSEHDRFVFLRTAAHTYASPAHHGAAHHDREDAELAIAMTAALLRVAPRFAENAAEADDSGAASS